ncbi:MAG: hypothetical protein KC419_25100, partial [Anaerolineales bacterium]|nr:hypothetical protein [Anaerolineales bacterium]
LHLNVLANTDPATILAQTERLDLRHTLFVVASKSGRTVETMAAFNYFYNRVAAVVGNEKAGEHFIAITDADSPLAQIATDYQFRHVFYNLTSLISRYAALSYIGLVPAALAGVNLETLLARAEGMACNAHSCNCPLEGDNAAAQLGTALGVLAQAGRNKLTFITSPALAGFADWVEQLLAGSTGKAGVGIIPVVGESVGDSAVYGPDRALLYLRLDGDDSQDTAVSTLQAAGFPVITVRWHDLSDLGGQFFLWQMAATVAAYHLNVNPFSQPQADALKAQIGEIVARIQAKEEPKLPKTAVILDTLPELHRFLAQAQPGTALAIQAFVPQTKEMDALLSTLRTQLRDRYQLATLVGYGPRCLHTIGQMLKGGPQNIYVVQLVATAKQDVPIPDKAGQPDAGLTFGKLQDIQATVDGRALRRAYRHVLHFQLGADVENRLRQFIGEEVAFQIK